MKAQWEHLARYWPAYTLMAVALFGVGTLMALAIVALPLIVMVFPLTIGAICVVVLIGWGRRRLQRRARVRDLVS